MKEDSLKRFATIYFEVLTVLSVVLYILLHSVPKQLELREFIYMDLYELVLFMWILGIGFLCIYILRHKATKKSEGFNALENLFIIMGAVIGGLILVVWMYLVALGTEVNPEKGIETSHSDGIITVKKGDFLDPEDVRYVQYESERIIYRRRID
ncbi:hypothetical protein SAMN02910377_01675 [Pseudobutyrivibrio ruminis]|uniref:Uncharacterized protein n=1 Tax=Pseudobutyrivibrio ruminis TaxID=46206 RepID=A0A1H7JFI9_9FIRM|nr:hypothetical protein [Pseudobutyrivibrio ruminis]SEK73174.1 hypothetical protein SAMN02910377_01675 [Pseudobutyrivibrio ruminis]